MFFRFCDTLNVDVDVDVDRFPVSDVGGIELSFTCMYPRAKRDLSELVEVAIGDDVLSTTFFFWKQTNGYQRGFIYVYASTRTRQ